MSKRDTRPPKDKLLKHPMYLREFIQCLVCWFYMGFWVEILNRRNWWSTAELTISGGAPFGLNKYMSSNRFESILESLSYTYQKDF